jgi:lipopolysaccharide exporter
MLTFSRKILRKTLSARLQRGGFLRNVSVVMTGTAIAQLISFSAMPVISRLFSPVDFGIFGSYSSVLAVLSAVVALQYTQAIVLAKDQEDAINLLVVCCLSVALVTGVTIVTVLLFPITVRYLINSPGGWFLLLLLVAMVVAGVNQTLQAWCIRVKAFKETSASQVVRSVSAVGLWTATGMSCMGALGLVLGSIGADIIANLNLWRVFKRDLEKTRTFLTWARIRQMAHEFREFAAFSAPQNLMNALSQGLPVLLLGYFDGVGVAGSYAFAIRILQTPMGVLLTPLRQVLFQKASESHNQGVNLYPLFLKTTCSLMGVALVPCASLFLWAPAIFSWIFGDGWEEAGIYARWLILWTFVLFSNVPSLLFARILRQQRNLFLYDCLVLLLRTAVLVIGGLYWSALVTVVLFSVLGFILNAALIVWIGTMLFFKQTEIGKTAL